MSKIYIAGKISGFENYKTEFEKAEKYLTSKGHICMNPAVLPEGFPYEAYIHICIAMINQCDSVYMLNNWKDSKGARFELEYAKVSGKEIKFL